MTREFLLLVWCRFVGFILVSTCLSSSNRSRSAFAWIDTSKQKL